MTTLPRLAGAMVSHTNIDLSTQTAHVWTKLLPSASDPEWIIFTDRLVDGTSTHQVNTESITGIAGCDKDPPGPSLAPVFLSDPINFFDVTCNEENVLQLPPSIDYNGFRYKLRVLDASLTAEISFIEVKSVNEIIIRPKDCAEVFQFVILNFQLINKYQSYTLKQALMRINQLPMKSMNLKERGVGLNKELSFQLPQFTLYNQNPLVITLETDFLLSPSISIKKGNIVCIAPTSRRQLGPHDVTVIFSE